MATKTTNPAEAQACWSCRAQVQSHFCEGCGSVQPPHPVDYFAFFALPRRLELDIAALEREFYRMSRKLHPDVYARASAQEQAWALEQSSRLNDAYRTLRDPIERTKYLLGLEGVLLEEQSRSATDKARATGEEKKQVVPPDLLEEVFDLNMQLQELKVEKQMGADDPELRQELAAHKQHFEAKLLALDNELRSAWKQWDSAPDAAARTQVRDQMVDLLNRRNYIRNLVRDVNEALEA
jgi:molecular chaperone HscB